MIAASIHRGVGARARVGELARLIPTRDRLHRPNAFSIAFPSYSLPTQCCRCATSNASPTGKTVASSASKAHHQQITTAPSVANATTTPRQIDPSILRGVLLDLHQRGMLADITNTTELVAHLNTPDTADPNRVLPRSVYAGFDPTAPSLHIGNLLVLMALRQFQKAGHRPICVVGGATGMIGDPSGRSTERTMLTEEQLQRNIAGITKDIKKFLDFEDASAVTDSTSTHPSSRSILLNNASWFSPLHVIPFFRDIGKHFRMGIMLAKDSVASRLNSDHGMSFTEFTYQVLQAYDFLHLYKSPQYHVTLQIGGTDQWGNITAGVDLIKREAVARAAATEPTVFGLTVPLLTTASGQKFGKSMGNAPIWLSAPDANATNDQSASASSPYQLYQYFLSTSDADAPRFLRLFTDLSIPEIEALEHQYSSDKKQLSKHLAEEVTRLVHGETGLQAAVASSKALFGASRGEESALRDIPDLSTLLQTLSGVPQVQFKRSELLGATVMDVTIKLGLAKSKGEVKRLVASGGLYLNNTPVSSELRTIQESDLLAKGRACVMRSGKKKQAVAIVAE